MSPKDEKPIENGKPENAGSPEQKEIERLKKDHDALKAHSQEMLQDNTRLNADVAHWKAVQNATQTSGETAITQMNDLLRTVIAKVRTLVGAYGSERKKAGCKDCDVSALLEEIERLTPSRLESRSPFARSRP